MLTIRSTLRSGIVNSRNWCSSSCSPVKVLHLETSLYHCSWVSVIIYVLAGGCWKRLTHGGLFLSFIDKGLQSGQVLHGSVKYTRNWTDKLHDVRQIILLLLLEKFSEKRTSTVRDNCIIYYNVAMELWTGERGGKRNATDNGHAFIEITDRLWYGKMVGRLS